MRHIVIFNLPDLGSVPFSQSLGPVVRGALTFLSGQYNAQLALALDGVSTAYDVNIVEVDAFAIINLLIASPAEFGLENVTQPARDCVGCDLDTYLFFDFVHPTTYGHGLIAEFAAEAMVDHYSPRKGKGYGPGTVNSLKGLAKP